MGDAGRGLKLISLSLIPLVLFCILIGGCLGPVPIEPDLTVEWYGFETFTQTEMITGIYPYPPLVQRPTIFSVSVKSNGTAPVQKSFVTRCFLDGKLVKTFQFPSEGELEDYPKEKMINIIPGGTRLYSCEVNISQPGQHTVKWIVDADSQIKETDESTQSNILEKTLTWQEAPDLVIEKIVPEFDPPTGGTYSNWTVFITNTGKGPVTIPFTSSLNYDSYDHPTPIAPGQSVSFTSRQRLMSWGDFTLEATVDIGNSVTESEPAGELNNRLEKTFNLLPVDLEVGNFRITPPMPVEGDNFTIAFNVDNAGNDLPCQILHEPGSGPPTGGGSWGSSTYGDAVNPFVVRLMPGQVYLSPKYGLLLQPLLFPVNQLKKNQVILLESKPLKASAGDLLVSASADDNGTYSEKDRDNNVCTQKIHVYNFTDSFQSLHRQEGTRAVLAILWDPKRPDHPAPHESQVEAVLFGGQNSVKEYFSENSNGIFTVKKAGVLGWYAAKNSGSYYWGPADQEDQPEDKNGNGLLDPGEDYNNNGILDGPNGKLDPGEDKNGNGVLDYDLVKNGFIHGHVEKWTEAIKKADPDFDFSAYDKNKDKKLTPDELGILICIPQNGPFGTSGGVPLEKEWPKNEPLVVDGVEIPYIAELYLGNPPHLGTATHELSHLLLDTPDMYINQGIILDKMKKSGIQFHAFEADSYSLMSKSAYHLDPFHKLKLGWVKPVIIRQSGQCQVRSVEKYHEVYVLYDPKRGAGEYFLVENRWPDDSVYDKGLPDRGLAVWHIIEDPDIYTQINEPYLAENDWGRRSIRLLRLVTSSLQDQNALWDGGESNYYDLTDTSSPSNLKWQDGTPSGFKIRAVSKAGSIMTATFEVPS